MLPRHQFVWLDQTLFAEAAVSDEADRALIFAWLSAGRPAIVRRSEVEGLGLPLGIALPLVLGRRRLALWTPEAAVTRSAFPPCLREAMAIAPHAWRPRLEALSARLQNAGADLHVYGSLGWQFLTGEIYLRAESDVDLLIVPRVGFDWPAAQSALEDIKSDASPRIDGELIIAEDRAVAWRELIMPTDRILVRSRTELALCLREDVLAALRRPLAPSESPEMQEARDRSQ